ncbi:XRE family transcriptional regulator [Anaerotruncus sp. 80]|uniref:XRE family transcriptional regulator n=1 Tax=Anaerotruncus colihominis TaxID=169435 RepID=A0A845QLY7_9FIRM|nr:MULTISPECIES: helix-turn-helix transcriptional regulator [Anaerotruncus]MCI9641116.1 helix-turn-helix transcriptional regulator [Emergencia sp.]NBH62444.1 XRE family transcriptional regulator [Anaerotruncus colihominis]NCF03099.1 XRE family transcriptional regulator [Anaerotruncus sp. 80]
MKLDHDKLDLLRARNVLTISQLAKVAKVSAATIVRGGNPGIVTVGKIAKALGVDVEEIIVKEE